jgi:glutamate synthase (NADPH/NADH) small chain
MPKPPEGENPATPWPSYPLVLKTTSSHEEGCTRRWGLDTRRFVGRDGAVTAAEVEEVEWVESPAGGRPAPHPTGRTEVIEAELVLLAMGFVHPVREGLLEALGVALDGRQNVMAADGSATSVPKVFVAGDATLGASLVVRAIASGQKTAKAVEKFLLS